MQTRRRRFIVHLARQIALLAVLLLPVCALGQSAVTPEALTGEVARLAAGAGTVFVGQIVAIHRTPGVVEVSFRVEQLLRGAVTTPGTLDKKHQTAPLITLREWAGMWAPGQQRYLPGARVLAFLHSASPAGFASPVHGSEGLIPVLVQGAGRTPLVDLRRVAASVVRGPQTPLPSMADASVPLNALLPVIATSAPAATLHGNTGGLPAGLRPTNGLVQSLQQNRGSLHISTSSVVGHHAAL